MSWHRRWHQPEELRPEGPASKLRQAMRQQMREDARRVIITPKYVPDDKAEIRHPSTRPPNPIVRELPNDIRLREGKSWFLA